MKKPKPRYTAKELRGMSLKALAEIGKHHGLKFTKNHTIADRAEKILAAYAKNDLAPEAGDVDSHQAEPSLHDRNQAFEDLCAGSSPTGPGTPDETVRDPRGGERDGAGRPLGMTDELAFYKRLPQQPHPAIRDFLRLAFHTWAAKSKCPAVELTEDEAFDLALPWTQAAHVAGVMDKLPAWLMVTLTCIWTTANMVGVKARVAREAASARCAAAEAGAELADKESAA